MGLTRKKITVRTKKGKTFQRSVMVRAEAIGRRAGGKKLNSLNPWEAHHTQHVKGQFPKSSGSSGPGSSHSAFALLVNHYKAREMAARQAGLDGGTAHAAQNAKARRGAGREGAMLAGTSIEVYRTAAYGRFGRHTPVGNPDNDRRIANRAHDLAEAFGVHHERVEHSPRRNNGTW